MLQPNRYEAILRLRQRAEDREAQAVALVRQRVLQARRERTSLELTRQSALEQAGATLQRAFDASEIRGYYQYERHLAALRDQKDADIRALLREEAEQLKLLEKATQARRIVEKLHERRRDAFHAHIEAEERKALDEVASHYAAQGSQLRVPAPRRGTSR